MEARSQAEPFRHPRRPLPAYPAPQVPTGSGVPSVSFLLPGVTGIQT